VLCKLNSQLENGVDMSPTRDYSAELAHGIVVLREASKEGGGLRFGEVGDA
jgi:hypothetical protein